MRRRDFVEAENFGGHQEGWHTFHLDTESYHIGAGIKEDTNLEVPLVQTSSPRLLVLVSD